MLYMMIWDVYGCIYSRVPSPTPKNLPNLRPSPLALPRGHRHIVPIRRLHAVGGAPIRHRTGAKVRGRRKTHRGAAGSVERGAGPRAGERGDRARGGGSAGDWTWGHGSTGRN